MGGKCTIILLFNIVATTCYNELTVFPVLFNDRTSLKYEFLKYESDEEDSLSAGTPRIIDIIRCTKFTMKRATRSHDTFSTNTKILKISFPRIFIFREPRHSWLAKWYLVPRIARVRRRPCDYGEICSRLKWHGKSLRPQSRVLSSEGKHDVAYREGSYGSCSYVLARVRLAAEVRAMVRLGLPAVRPRLPRGYQVNLLPRSRASSRWGLRPTEKERRNGRRKSDRGVKPLQSKEARNCARLSSW